MKCSWGYEEMLVCLFRELLLTIHRRMTESIPRISGFIQDEMSRARHYFEEHYNEDISIEQYAASRSMSTSWFTRSFRSATGTSPMQYILQTRIRNAQTLLETTDDSISNIASIVGYDNPMYFSRLFSRAKGPQPDTEKYIVKSIWKKLIKGNSESDIKSRPRTRQQSVWCGCTLLQRASCALGIALT